MSACASKSVLRFRSINHWNSVSFKRIVFPERIENACVRYRADKPSTYIAGGSAAAPNEFPWMAALGYFNLSASNVEYRCGGTIISDRFVLTAAHCTSPENPPVLVRMGSVSDAIFKLNFDVMSPKS